MNEFLPRVQSAVQNRRLLPRGQKILVAVSGGVDSMALLHALHSLARQNRWKISVAHFNHRLRGRASDADARLVRRTAEKLGLKCFAGGAEVKGFAVRAKISVEMAARKLRHEFLARMAREQKIPVIALAHHADDQVELFFLRLLRGAGGAGLAGMKGRSPSPADRQIALVRPLLAFTKPELLEFARDNKIRFRDDATNFSSDVLRNRIRNELLPLLRNHYQPAVDRTVLRLMDIIGAEAEFVGAEAESFCRSRREEAQIKSGKRKAESGNKSEPPCVGCYDDLPVAIQRRVLQSQLAQLGVVADFELVEQLRETPGRRVNAAAGIFLQCDATGKISCCAAEPAGFNAGELKVKLSGSAGRVMFGGRKFGWKTSPARNLKSAIGNRQSAMRREGFDADKVGGEIILRHWRPGDRFQPIGLKSAVKLQDLFVNARIPAARRRGLVLAATAAGEIFWVEGLRIGEKCKLTPQTRRQLSWNWSRRAS